MEEVQSGRWRTWRMAHQLMLAGAILLLPLLVISLLYYQDREQEIAILRQQDQQADFLLPIHKMLHALSEHRGLLNVALRIDPTQLFVPIEARIEQAGEHFTRNLEQLQKKTEQMEPASANQLARIVQLWSEVQQLKQLDRPDNERASEVFELQGDISNNLLQLLKSLSTTRGFNFQLGAILIEHIPALSESTALLRGNIAGQLAQSAELNHLGDGVVVKLSQDDAYTIRNQLALAQYDFIKLRDMLEQTFDDGLERERTVQFMYDLVNAMQGLEDLIFWEILDSEQVTQSGEEFFLNSMLISRSLFELMEMTETLYQQKIREGLVDQLSSRNWVLNMLLTMIVLAILISSTIVRTLLGNFRTAIRNITWLGSGDYTHPITSHETSRSSSIEMAAMFYSIEQARQNLLDAAENTAQAHQKTEEQRNFFNDLTNNMQSGVYALDAEGQVTFINPVAEEILGYKRAELLGKNIHEIIHAHLPDGTFVPLESCPVHKAMCNDTPYHVELDWFTRKDGSMVPVEFNAAPLHTGEEVSGSVAVFNDITIRMQMETELKNSIVAAKEADRAKSYFLANISHEIRTPMNSVIGSGYLALQSAESEKQKGYLSKLLSAANSLLTLINGVLDFSKIEAGKMEIERVAFDLAEVANNSCQLLQDRCDEKGITLQLKIDPHLCTALVGDPVRIGQVLINLISNAVKFTDEGTIEVEISLLSGKGNNRGQLARFSVTDPGIGMTQAQQEKLFQPFTQADGSISRKYGGTGLGLSICKQLVEMMGGEIFVHSEQGVGSSFQFSLPLTVDGAFTPSTAVAQRHEDEMEPESGASLNKEGGGATREEPLPENFVVLLEELVNLSEQYDTAALDRIEHMIDIVGQHQSKPQLIRIRNELQHYQFDSVRELVEPLIQIANQGSGDE